MAVFASPASKFRWAYLYTNLKKEVFMDSHVRFFEVIGGAYKELVYDNMRNVVSRFIGENRKELNKDLLNMSIYYGFEINVTNCFSGNEKGFVESSVKHLRREIFTKKYKFDCLDEAEKHLETALIKLNKDASEIEEEKKHLLAWRPALELGVLTEQMVNKYSMIQLETNHYSVPDHLVGEWVKVKTYRKEILIYSDSRVVAKHKKIDGFNEYEVDIFHYLDTLERKPGAIKNSKALKSKTQLKTIYDMYFTKRPKQFIYILRKYQENKKELLKKMIDVGKACEMPMKQLEDVFEDNVSVKTKNELERLSALYMGDLRYVN